MEKLNGEDEQSESMEKDEWSRGIELKYGARGAEGKNTAKAWSRGAEKKNGEDARRR